MDNPRDAIAFKWKDELKETKLLEIEWSASRTGLINPIAIFEPVELEGTTVSRASLHNISIMEGLELGIGDMIQVYKANMIIPQISENLTRSGTLEIPKVCPVCHQPTKISQENDVKVLTCPNPDCEAKHIKGLSLFGEKSYANLIQAIEKSRNIPTARFVYSLGIPNVGLSNAKLLCRYFKDDIAALMSADVEEITTIEGIGPIIAKNVESFFADSKIRGRVEELLSEVHLEKELLSEDEMILKNMTFVITGSVHHFANRNEVKALIESRGGKVAGSVSSKTNYLINNDAASASSKNKKAKELGVSIITEDEFLELIEKNRIDS